MRYNRLGSTGLFVSELCFGTMTFAGTGQFAAMGSVQQVQAEELLRRAFNAGVNFIDTADVYSGGEAEIITGKALKSIGIARAELILATKVFGQMGTGPNSSGSSRKHIIDGVKASLARLQTDYIDLYQLHGFDPATPIDESLAALDDLVRQGLVRYIGVSNWAGWQITKALGISDKRGFARFASVQSYYTLAARDLEREIVPMAVSEGLGVLVWSPLAGGLLGGKISRVQQNVEGTRRSAMAFPPVAMERAYDIIDALQALALEKKASVAQLAVAWLLHQSSVTSVILGAKRLEQLDDTLGAVEVALSAEEIASLNAVSALPPEYPGWMIDMWSGTRAAQMAGSRR